MKSLVLLCTVGGSHQPIVTSIRELAPEFVCFLCTDRDPATGNPGSRVQVEGKGLVIKARHEDLKPTLPNIPEQTGLAEGSYEVRAVPADQLDGVVESALRAIGDLRRKFPNSDLVADYTGGTKTMTAGLAIAALESPDVALRLVTGARGDLLKVHDGTQSGATAVAEAIRLRRSMAPYVAAWAQFGYAAAAAGFRRISAPGDPVIRAEWQIARDTSIAFDAWDRFDHVSALSLLGIYRQRVGKQMGLLLTFLETLCLEDSDLRKEPARLLDLWLNAERRAQQGRFDDAVGRTYRLLEWTAQWLLRTRAGIHTADVPAEKAGEGVRLNPNRDGRLQAGLYSAWQLVACHVDGPAAAFAREQADPMLDHLKVRNASILAHGFTPIGATDWAGVHDWVERAFLPMLKQEVRSAGFRMDPPQLPQSPPWKDGSGGEP